MHDAAQLLVLYLDADRLHAALDEVRVRVRVRGRIRVRVRVRVRGRGRGRARRSCACVASAVRRPRRSIHGQQSKACRIAFLARLIGVIIR